MAGQASVIVAGGGPVGLFAAALLDASGVAVEVYEREPGPSEYSKAMVLHPRTLEVLDVLETAGGRLSDVVMAEGRPGRYTHFAALPSLLDYSGLDTPYPHVLMIPQARTERLLADHLRERGVPVHYGRAVTGFDQIDGGVQVHLGDSVREAEYLVGADGAHSTVRALAGIDFPGTPPQSLGFVGDVYLAEPPPSVRHLWSKQEGQASIVPMPGGLHRVFGTVAADTRLTPEEIRIRQVEPLSLEELRGTLQRISGTDWGIHEAHTLARTSDSTRHAAHYRAGRVFIAGDAAHVHLPAGGQGLNVGLQDAANLCWKLAAEIDGWAPARVVDGGHSYEHERRRVARLLAENTLAQGGLMKTFTAEGEALRVLMSSLIARGGDTAEELMGWLSGLDLSYPHAEGSDPLVGTRVANVDLCGQSVFRALRPDRFLLMDFSGAFAGLGSSRVDVRAARSAPGRWSDVAAALVRPDGYVADVVASSEPDAVAEFKRAVETWTTATA